MFPTGVGRSGVGSDAKIDIPIAASSVNRFVAPRAGAWIETEQGSDLISGLRYGGIIRESSF